MVGTALGTAAQQRLSQRQQQERQAAAEEQAWLDGLFYQSMITSHKVRALCALRCVCVYRVRPLPTVRGRLAILSWSHPPPS